MFDKAQKVASKLMYAIPVAVFLCFVFYITTFTYTGAAQKTVESTKWSFDSFVDLSNQFEKVLQNSIYKKYGFINLNGRIAKYLGFNSLNSRLKLANGHLTYFSGVKEIKKSVKSIIELNNFLSEREIPFLYVFVSNKNSMYDVKFPPGYREETVKNLDGLAEALNKAEINNLNMDLWFRQNVWHMDDVFFRTDHHWLPQAGLAAAQQTMELLQQQGIVIYDREKLLPENYKIKVLKNWFLGNQGKRTGKYYAGIDDFPVFIPKFRTNYSYQGITRGTTTWNYSNSLLRTELMKTRDLFMTDPHCIYLYGDLPVQVISNTEAVNNKRLLLIGDSFRRIWEYFLATQFQKIYFLDTRYYTDGSLAQYIEEIRPDIVVMCSYINTIDDSYLYRFGIEDYNSALAATNRNEPGILLGDFEIPSQDKNNNNFVTVGANLEPGQTYTLTVDKIKVLKGKVPHAQITLRDQTANKAIVNHYFETSETYQQKWIFTVPMKPNNYDLFLYAGTKEHTARNSVNVTNILLRKGIHEE